MCVVASLWPLMFVICAYGFRFDFCQSTLLLLFAAAAVIFVFAVAVPVNVEVAVAGSVPAITSNNHH